MGGSHEEEMARAATMNDRPAAEYNATHDLRMRDLMARIASLPPEGRTLAFRKFDEVLSEIIDFLSPAVFADDLPDTLMARASIDDLAEKRKELADQIEAVEKAQSDSLQRLSAPVKGAGAAKVLGTKENRK